MITTQYGILKHQLSYSVIYAQTEDMVDPNHWRRSRANEPYLQCYILFGVTIDGVFQQVRVTLFAVSQRIFGDPLLDFPVPFFARQLRQRPSGTPRIRVLAVTAIDLSHGPVDLQNQNAVNVETGDPQL